MNNNNIKKPRKINNSKANKKFIDENYFLQNMIAEKDAIIKRLKNGTAVEELTNENEDLKYQLRNAEEEIERLSNLDKDNMRAITEMNIYAFRRERKVKELEKDLAAYKELCLKLEQLVFKHD